MAIAAMASNNSSSPPKDVCSEDGKTDAFFISQTFVSRQLKAPSTAKYPYSSSEGVTITHKGGCTFLVMAFVDAQNAFGAMIRSRYIADLTHRPAQKDWLANKVVVHQ